MLQGSTEPSEAQLFNYALLTFLGIHTHMPISWVVGPMRDDCGWWARRGDKETLRTRARILHDMFKRERDALSFQAIDDGVRRTLSITNGP